MKKLILLFMVIFSTVFTLSAQKKVSEKAIISLPTLQPCEECIEKLQLKLSREEGVTGLNINVKKKILTVIWLTERTNKENIKVAIANLGYMADDIEAEETAYKRLPKCCKVPETPAPPPKKG